jgi:hypothetical protein
LDVGYVEFVNFALAFWDEIGGKFFEIIFASGTVVGCARKGSHVVQNVSKQPLRSDRIPALVFLEVVIHKVLQQLNILDQTRCFFQKFQFPLGHPTPTLINRDSIPNRTPKQFLKLGSHGPSSSHDAPHVSLIPINPVRDFRDPFDQS